MTLFIALFATKIINGSLKEKRDLKLMNKVKHVEA